ncbi:MAG TPA: ABC transporter permease subunit, partial [Pseudonocardiaceae bacterium]|nr:ABC transporter permease subunit [Pseudonocardiaceae bacterium]
MISDVTSPDQTATGGKRQICVLDLLWLVWRQHRWTIITGVVLLLAAWGFVLWNESTVNPTDFARCRELCQPFRLFGTFADQRLIADVHVVLAGAFGLFIAVFWAAPLIAREYEQHTNLLVWSQDVSVPGWLLGKIVPLAGVATGLAVLLSAIVSNEVDRMHALANTYYAEFTLLHFEASVPLQAAYALFGFALGVAVSALVRRTVPAMAITAVLFSAVRLGMIPLRYHYFPPVRLFTPLAADNSVIPTGDYLAVDFGYVNASGQLVGPSFQCTGPTNTAAEYRACLRQNGIAGSVIDYQPADRLATFRLIEAGIFV